MEGDGERMEVLRSETQVVVIPFAVQGHINPMLQFSKRLASKGLSVAFCVPTSTGKAQALHPCFSFSSAVQLVTFYDGFSEKAEHHDAYFERFRAPISQSLNRLLSLNPQIRFVIYNSIMPWVIDIVRGHGVDGAPFFTQSCNVCAVFAHVHRGVLKAEDLESSEIRLPAMPALNPKELPSFVYDMGYCSGIRDILINQFSSDLRRLDWLFFNTFDDLEMEIANWMRKEWSVKTVGPCIPSAYMDKRMKDDKEYGLNTMTAANETGDTGAAIKWLETKDTGSAVYVSFGSLAEVGADQMEEMAFGLMNCGSPFLWVVRESEVPKLPAGFVDEIMNPSRKQPGKGTVVGWCNQLEVLAHGAVGCFVSHCGWNSTLEALSSGMPIVAVPQWTDQTTNAKFVADVWGTGTRSAKKGGSSGGVVSREEVGVRIREVMGAGPRGESARKNVGRWKELARRAVDEGGTSDANIDEFVAHLLRH